MGLLQPCFLLLCVSTFTAGADFQQGSKPRGQSGFVKRSHIEEKAARIVKRSLPAWLAASPSHKIKRRSDEQGDSCRALQGYDTKLADNTHSVSYQLRSCYSSHVSQLNDDAQVLTRCANRPNQLFGVKLATDGLFSIHL